MLVIIDYGMGNIKSISNALKYNGFESFIISDTNELKSHHKIVLPGVGHFKKGMEEIKSRGFYDYFIEHGHKHTILGICLGMQLLCRHSEEGDFDGLGLVPADVVRFPKSDLKVPNMGWRAVKRAQDHIFTEEITEEDRFYFVHSYYCKCDNDNNVLLKSDFGLTFASGIVNGSVMGVQFHPEKSLKYGLKLLKAFAELP